MAINRGGGADFIPMEYEDEGITVEDFSKPFPDFLGRLGERVSYPGNQSGIINALPNIINNPGVTTREGALIDGDDPMSRYGVQQNFPLSIDPSTNTAASPNAFTTQYFDDLIMNPEGVPNRLQNLERFADNRFEDAEFIPGYDFVDAPNKATNLIEVFKNINYLNNPRTGFIDNTLLARGNPEASLVNRTKDGIMSVLSKIPTPFNLVRRGFDAITGPRRETTGIVYDDRGRGYTPEELNRMNAKGGYYSEPAREQRRRERRVENLLERKAAGKSYSQKNLNELTTGGSKPGTYTTPGSGNAGSSSGGKSIVCTAMYQTTGLQDWKKAMKIWYIYQKKHLTDTHQEGYHWLFKPFVKAMKKSKIVEALGAHVAKHRTQELKHILFNSKSDKLGKVYNMILEPICFIAGKIKSALGRG